MQRALEQMAEVTHAWGQAAQRRRDEIGALQWFGLEALASSLESTIDPYRVAESWLGVIAPALAHYRETNHKARFILLKHVRPALIENELPYEDVASAFIDLPAARAARRTRLGLHPRRALCILMWVHVPT